MFGRFPDDARRAMDHARQVARELGHDYIGTEHILWGLCKDPGNAACRVLCDLGVDAAVVPAHIGAVVKGGRAADRGQLPFTPRAKRALEAAMAAALALDHGAIGTQHLLVGLAATADGVAAQVLAALAVDPVSLRATVERHWPRGSIVRPPAEPATSTPVAVPEVGAAMAAAAAEAERRGRVAIDVPLLLWALLKSDDGFAAPWLAGLGVGVARLRADLRARLRE